MNVILASASPRRKELLTKLYDTFTVEPAGIDEELPDDIGPEFAPLFLSAAKANEVACRHRDDLVIAADTIVAWNGEILGKPRDEEDAFRMLQLLSGNTHKVLTGCTVSYKGESVAFTSGTYVTFYPLKEDEIREYISTGEPFGKAGAYAIQGRGAFLVEAIDGDFYNVVGLPIARLKREIASLIAQTERKDEE